MTINSVNSQTFLSDTIIYIRDDLRDNIVDPISATRPSNENFVMTSFPQRSVTYPIITIRDINTEDIRRLGIGSELHLIRIPLEIRIWARNIKEKDELFQVVVNRLRSTQLSGASSKRAANLHDFKLLSATNVDESGDGATKSKVIQIEYVFILGA